MLTDGSTVNAGLTVLNSDQPPNSMKIIAVETYCETTYKLYHHENQSVSFPPSPPCFTYSRVVVAIATEEAANTSQVVAVGTSVAS